MGQILCIETATGSCSIAFSNNGIVISAEESGARNTHSSVITNLIETVLVKAGKGFHEIDAVAIGEGPGSYTGLRIGVATAKGLCYALEKPLIAVSTLHAMSIGMQEAMKNREKKGNALPVLYCPMIDARRMEVYCAIYDSCGKELYKPTAEIITETSFSRYLHENMMVFAGDGALKCKHVLEQIPHTVFLDDINASAVNMAGLAEEKFSKNDFEGLAYFEPFYLKDFVAGKPKVKGLR